MDLVNDKLSTLLIALLGGAVAVLGVGQITGAGADSAATSQQPMIIRVESPAAAAGGDTTSTVKLSDVAGLCALGNAPHSDGSGSGSSGSAHSSSRAAAVGAVNSSGNSANANTNVLALNNQIGLEQKTVVVQQDTNGALAAQQQGQAQDPTTTTTDPTLTATAQDTTPTTTTAAPTTTTEAPTTTLAPTIDTTVPIP